MSFTTKQWKDRISEYPTRRTLTDTTSSAVSTVTVAREEGTISQEGDAFSATNMNDLETRISNGFSTLSNDSVVLSSTNTTTDSIKFGKDSSNNYGYIIPGADTVVPFSKGVIFEKTVTVNISSRYSLRFNIMSEYPKYADITSDNICVEINQIYFYGTGLKSDTQYNYSFTSSYVASTGTITLTTNTGDLPFRWGNGTAGFKMRIAIVD